MFKANIKFRDGSILNDVFLYKEQTLWTSIILHKEEAIKLLGMGNIIYFGNDGVQGGFIPVHVESYEFVDLTEEELNEQASQKLLEELTNNLKNKMYREGGY